MNSFGVRTAINLMIRKCRDQNLASRNTFLVAFQWQATTGFERCSITLIDKIDPFHLLRRENYHRQTPKTMVPYGLIEDSVSQVFLFLLFDLVISVIFTRPACFKDYDFGITELVLLVNIVASFVVHLLLFILFICLFFILIRQKITKRGTVKEMCWPIYTE